jgi:hypothetical protein
VVRQASELRRLALYFDVGTALWADEQRDWGSLPLEAWDAVFKPGIAAAEAPAAAGGSDDAGGAAGMKGPRCMKAAVLEAASWGYHPHASMA